MVKLNVCFNKSNANKKVVSLRHSNKFSVFSSLFCLFNQKNHVVYNALEVPHSLLGFFEPNRFNGICLKLDSLKNARASNISLPHLFKRTVLNGPRAKFLTLSHVQQKYQMDIVFDKNMTTVCVGDLEGEFSSFIVAMLSLGATIISEKISDDGIQYLDFDLNHIKEPKKIKILGDICDRGIFGINLLKTIEEIINKNHENLIVEFVLGNHDLAYVLMDGNFVPKEFLTPSICQLEGDPAFEKIKIIFNNLINKNYVKLAIYDEQLNHLTSHSIFTVGENGFLKTFLKFINDNPLFSDLLKSKKINISLLKENRFHEWGSNIEKKKVFMNNLVDAYNCLLDTKFLNSNKKGIRNLLFTDYSPISQKGFHLRRQMEAPVLIYYLNNKKYPIPYVIQLNGHWPLGSHDPGAILFGSRNITKNKDVVMGIFKNSPSSLKVAPDEIGPSMIFKLDCASSSEMLPNGDSHPTCFYSDPKDSNGIRKINVFHDQEGVKYKGNFFNRLNSAIKTESLKSLIDYESNTANLSKLSAFDDSHNDIKDLAAEDLSRDGVRRSFLPILAKHLLSIYLLSDDSNQRTILKKYLGRFTTFEECVKFDVSTVIEALKKNSSFKPEEFDKLLSSNCILNADFLNIHGQAFLFKELEKISLKVFTEMFN